MTAPRASCPRCGSVATTEILWGDLVGPIDIEPWQTFGGCIENRPAWSCGTCGHRWDIDQTI